MAKKMLIDASHREEIRMAIIDGNRLQGFETESISKKQLKSNIYLAKVIRIEPSLQACFVEFGGNRQGFLPFSEIHPDYYQIPVGDRIEDAIIPPEGDSSETIVEGAEDIDVEEDNLSEDDLPRKPKLSYRYKIQEVVKRKQIMLVQVVREERGNKGAALTTYLTLAGRYCVLMPNSGSRSGGISRKIQDPKDRKRLRAVLDSLDIPEGVSIIIRTAGSGRTKLELKRDFEYLLRLWSDIREKTMTSIAPALIYEEGDLIKRTLRDAYDKDIDDIFVEGEEGYKEAKNLMRTMLPSHAKKVQHFKDKATSLFQKFGIEDQIDQMFQPSVPLPSGGSIVIAQTEALVAVDVNSGKSTRERHIDDTAIKTNLEAAKEVARQMRLRDLGGLIVIDFIDMNDRNHINQVERALRDAVQQDRARIQLGKISQFGLLELSRQRLRPSIQETHTRPCEVCHGTGIVRSIESMALFVLRQIEGACVKGKISEATAFVPAEVDHYLLNQKRSELVDLENLYEVKIFIKRDTKLKNSECHIETVRAAKEISKADQDDHLDVIEPVATKPEKTQQKQRPQPQEQAKVEVKAEDKEPSKKRNRRKKRNRGDNDRPVSSLEEAMIAEIEGTASDLAASEETQSADAQDGAQGERKGRRRRFRDRRRRRNNRDGQSGNTEQVVNINEQKDVLPQGVELKSVETIIETATEETPKVKKGRPSKKQPAEQQEAANSEETKTSETKKRKGWWKRLIES